MILTLTASADTYITNKVISNTLRATDANVGRAGTLDLFKLYDESVLSGTTEPTELSRVLFKFNYEPLHALTGTKLDISDSNFSCILKLKDIGGSYPRPTNFNLALYPLSKSFDEGYGLDVGAFSQIGNANYITSSYNNGVANIWNVSGANGQGLLGSDNLDIIVSGNIGSGVENLYKTLNFPIGNEDLSLDITNIVSATLKGLIPDHGFVLAYSGTEETDQKSRFVKRFASRHVANPFKIPKILVTFDDSIIDHSENFVFDVSGTIFLRNYVRNRPRNIVSGTAASEISGNNSLILQIKTGSYSKIITASQHNLGALPIKGLYSASFAISAFESGIITGSDTIRSYYEKSGSLTFDTYWKSLDSSIGYHTGTLTVNRHNTLSFINNAEKLNIRISNGSKEFRNYGNQRFKFFVTDLNDINDKPFKISVKRKTTFFEKVYYRVRDFQTGQIVIPVFRSNNGTRLSSDSESLYFDFDMSNLSKNRSYYFELLFDMGDHDIWKSVKSYVFRVF